MSESASVDLPEPLEAKSQHETIFSVFLLALAFLFRDNPSIVYPELLYVFISFLVFNFLYNRFLKQKARSSHLAYSPVFVNGILITWALHYSGGPDSYLWVMYLLPIFTACLLFNTRGIVISTFYVLALQASLYGDALWDISGWDGLQLLSKTALLVLSASVTTGLARAERRAKADGLIQRKRYEEALEKLRNGVIANARKEKAGDDDLFAGGIHDVNTVLGIILGSVQLISRAAAEGPGREDLGRIESAVRFGKALLQNLFLLGQPQTDWPRRSGSLHAVLEEAAVRCRGEARSKGVAVELSLKAPQDEAVLNEPLLQQAFANILFAAVASTPPRGQVKVFTAFEPKGKGGAGSLKVMIEDGGARMEKEGLARFFDPHWISPGRGKGVGLGLYLAREIILRHGGKVDLSPMEGEGNRMEVRFPAGAAAGGNAPIKLDGLASVS